MKLSLKTSAVVFAFSVGLFIPTALVFADYSITTGSISTSTEYQNTSGSDQILNFIPGLTPLNATELASSTVYSVSGANTSVVAKCNGGAANRTCTLTVVVPNNYYYRFNTVGSIFSDTLVTWNDLGGAGATNNYSTTTYSVGAILIATSSALSVDNASMNLLGGVLVFLGSMIFVIWLFRRQRV